MTTIKVEYEKYQIVVKTEDFDGSERLDSARIENDKHIPVKVWSLSDKSEFEEVLSDIENPSCNKYLWSDCDVSEASKRFYVALNGNGTFQLFTSSDGVGALSEALNRWKTGDTEIVDFAIIEVEDTLC